MIWRKVKGNFAKNKFCLKNFEYFGNKVRFLLLNKGKTTIWSTIFNEIMPNFVT